MLNPSQKGLISYVNTVDIRGSKRVNVYAAACGIAYGKDYEAEFFSKDMKAAAQLRNQLLMKHINPGISFEEALYEVLINYFEQAPLAKEVFEGMTDLSCTDETFGRVLTRIKDSNFQFVPEMSAMLDTKVEGVEEPETATEAVEDFSETEAVVPEDSYEGSTETNSSEVADSGEHDSTESSEENVVAAEDNQPEQLDMAEDVNIEEEEPPTVLPESSESSAPLVADVLKNAREESEKHNTTESEYAVLFRDKITTEVNNFKLLPNSNTAAELLDKIESLLPGMEVIDIVYNKSILHALLIEFNGAASMLSSFRVLALGLSTRK